MVCPNSGENLATQNFSEEIINMWRFVLSRFFQKKKVIINLTPPPMPVANSEEVKNKCSIALGDST